MAALLVVLLLVWPVAGLNGLPIPGLTPDPVEGPNLFQEDRADLTVGFPLQRNGLLTHHNFAPGDVATGTLVLYSTGAAAEEADLRLGITMGIEEEDAQGGDTNFSRYLHLTYLRYGDTALTSRVPDLNENGYPDLEDLEQWGFWDLDDPGPAGEVLVMQVRFHPSGGSWLMGDVVRMAMTFHLEPGTQGS